MSLIPPIKTIYLEKMCDEVKQKITSRLFTHQLICKSTFYKVNKSNGQMSSVKSAEELPV